MTPRDTTPDGSRLTRRQRTILSLVAVVCILFAGATLVAAQASFSEDFEDGQADGWSGEFSVEPVSTNGEWSIHQTDSEVNDRVPDSAVWDDGPLVDLNESFTITGTVQPVNPSAQGGGVRFGMVDQNLSDELRMSFGHQEENATRLTYAEGGADIGSSVGQVDDNFDGDWANVELHSPGDEDTLYGKVWHVGNSEPSEYQMDLSIEGFAGRVSIQAGQGTNGREIYLDDAQLQDVTVINGSDDLRLDVPKYLMHNASSHYAVEANQSGEWVDVTDAATVTPNNTDALTFYPDNNTVVAGPNKSINERVGVIAEHDGLNATEDIVVATPTVDNLDLLPAWWSVNAVLSDWTMIWILLATLIATAASRMSTTFAGIGAFVMAMILGWIMGDVPDGIMVATIFMGLFIGLNLAANIDYSVR